jgi:hypothetical protein
MTAQGYGPGSQGRKRKTWIVMPATDQPTRGAARNAWEEGEGFRVVTSDGIGRAITKADAIAENIAEVTIVFDGRRQSMNVRVDR